MRVSPRRVILCTLDFSPMQCASEYWQDNKPMHTHQKLCAFYERNSNTLYHAGRITSYIKLVLQMFNWNNECRVRYQSVCKKSIAECMKRVWNGFISDLVKIRNFACQIWHLAFHIFFGVCLLKLARLVYTTHAHETYFNTFPLIIKSITEELFRLIHTCRNFLLLCIKKWNSIPKKNKLSKQAKNYRPNKHHTRLKVAKRTSGNFR